MVFKPESLGGDSFLDRVEELIAAILEQPGTRLPGSRRLENRDKAHAEGVEIPDTLLDETDTLLAG